MHAMADETTDERRWGAVVRRDREADGGVFYAVKTTGIYCRPARAARRPNRANVVFFSGADEAERAGYRACKRCKPTSSVHPRAYEAVSLACARIEGADEPPSLAELAAEVGLSPAHFHRL